MSQVFTIHSKEKCIICNETLLELQVGRFKCVHCGAGSDVY